MGDFADDYGGYDFYDRMELDEQRDSERRAQRTKLLTPPPPVQEPVAYLCENAVGHKYFRWKKPSSTYKPIALYTILPAAKRQWRGLTDKEFEEIIMSAPNATVPVVLWQLIQDKLKEKNT
jgi:hypothetical protein